MQTKKQIKKQNINPDSAEEAFTLSKPELEAIDVADLVQINVDIPMACTVALGAADRLDKLAAEMAELTGFDRKAQKNLRRYALAALYANAVSTDPSSEDKVTTLLVEATPLREGMLVAAEALAHRGMLSAQRVAEIRSGQGHLDTADDLIALSALFREAWSTLQGKTAVTREEIERAAVLGSQLHIALGVRRVGTEVGSSSAQTPMFRERAFTLFVRAYDECRRAVTYLRWHEDDLTEFAPSIYNRRKRRPGAEPETPSTDVPTPGTPRPSVIPDLTDAAVD